jgi:hypothetical protein
MRLATKVVVLGLAVSVLGAADARAPELRGSPVSPESTNPIELQALTVFPDLQNRHELPTNTKDGADLSGTDQSALDLWLLGGVCAGLVAYQLRRKHRLLRPHTFTPQSDL